MTNSPAAGAAPIDFAQLRAAAQEAVNAPEAPRKETFDIGGHKFPLVTVITPLDMIELQDAQESGSFRELITAMPRLVPKEYRDSLLELLLSDPDDQSQRINFDDLLEEFKLASEAINARPTDR